MEIKIQVGHWINIFTRVQSQMALDKQEFFNNVLLRYQVIPNNLPDKFDVCVTNKPFKLQHSIQFKLGGGGDELSQ